MPLIVLCTMRDSLVSSKQDEMSYLANYDDVWNKGRGEATSRVSNMKALVMTHWSKDADCIAVVLPRA